MKDVFEKYFYDMFLSFGETSILPTHEHHSEDDFYFVKIPDRINELNEKISNKTKIRIFQNHLYNFSPPLNDFENEIFERKIDWMIRNSPLMVVEACKNRINDSIWSGVKNSDLRNKIRKKLDEKLLEHPIIQTNPYETWPDVHNLKFCSHSSVWNALSSMAVCSPFR